VSSKTVFKLAMENLLLIKLNMTDWIRRSPPSQNRHGFVDLKEYGLI